MVLECKGICLRTGGEYKDVFIKKKRYNYSKESECKICGIGINKPTFRNVDLKIGCESDPNTNYYNISGSKQRTLTIVPITMQFPDEFPCPCCGAEPRGKKLPQVKEYFEEVNREKGTPVYIKTNPIENKEKSYKELIQELEKQELKVLNFNIYDYKRQLGYTEGRLRPTRKEKSSIEDFLYSLKSEDSEIGFSYENKLAILKQYDDTGFRNSDGIYDTNLDRFVILLNSLDNNKQKERYVRKFCNLLDKFAKKYNLGMGGLTVQEQKIESRKRLEEGDKRRASIGRNGRYYYPYQLYDKEGNEITNETETSHVD